MGNDQGLLQANQPQWVRGVPVVAPAPASLSSATPPTVESGLASVQVEIAGASNDGSGFFDPGEGFPNRLEVSVSGGVTVSAVTYNSPTSITLDLSTVGAATGPRTVTVTNPDGQVVTSLSGFLTVGVPGAPTISAIVPSSGPASGATAVDLTGTLFVTGATVSIGGVPATDVVVGSDTSASAVTPALAPGTLNDVSVQNPDTLVGTLFAAFLADFLDVPQGDIFHASVEALFRS